MAVLVRASSERAIGLAKHKPPALSYRRLEFNLAKTCPPAKGAPAVPLAAAKRFGGARLSQENLTAV
jgi:hypothetical protein